MLFARFRYRDRDAYGVVDGGRIRPVKGDIFGAYRVLSRTVPLAGVRLLPPVRPTKILAAAVNYPSHLASGRAVLGDAGAPQQPELFLKPPSAVTGPEEPIVLPRDAGRVDCEGELVAVIGRPCRRVSADRALEFVFGYTCGNDVSARHWQRGDLQWWRAKGSDTFAPIGPFIATGLDPTALELRTRLNGRPVQAVNTAALIFSLAELVAWASQAVTLEPGDLLFTGTPGETAALTPGDVVEVEIEGIGVLRNRVVANEE